MAILTRVGPSSSMVLFTAAVLLGTATVGEVRRARTRQDPSLRTSSGRSGWRDSNPRPPAPKAGALPSCATPRGTPSLGGPRRAAVTGTDGEPIVVPWR